MTLVSAISTALPLAREARPLSAPSFVADQLRAAYPAGEWNAGGVDRAYELGEIMAIHHGIVDLTRLGIARIDEWDALARVGSIWTRADVERFNAPTTLRTVRTREGSFTYTEPRGTWADCEFEERGRPTSESPPLCRFVSAQRPGPIEPGEILAAYNALPLVLTYDGQEFGFLGDANNDGSISNAKPTLEPHQAGPSIAWSARGSGGCGYVIVRAGAGFAIAPMWGEHGDPAFWKANVMMTVAIASTAFTLFAPTVNPSALLGKAITGAEFAAAYPAISAAIGQVTISTALTGGDVERAAALTAASYAGTIAGNYAAVLSDSSLVGKIAASAITAELSGGDPENAARNTLLQFGLQRGVEQMEIYFDDIAQPAIEQSFVDQSNPWGFDAALIDTGPVVLDAGTFGHVTTMAPDFFSPSVSFGNLDSLPNLFPAPGAFPSDVWNPATLPPVQNPSFPAPVPTTQQTSGWDFAIAALKLLPQFINKPAPVVVPAQRTPTGAMPNPGSLPVNQPQSLPDGRIVVNNGNGTYSVVGTDGRSTTQPIPGFGTAPRDFGVTQPMMLGMLALGGVLLFTLFRKGAR